MPYTTFTTEEIVERYQREKDAMLELLIRHPYLSEESVYKLGESIRLMQAELKKRGQLPIDDE